MAPKSKSKPKSTAELLKMYDDNSFLKNFKNKELSEMIKGKSENDIQKNAMKIGNLIYKLIIKRLPLIIYTLISIDNKLGELSLLRNPVIRAIYTNKGTKLQKINQLYNYLMFTILEKPYVLAKLVGIIGIKDIFDERKINIKLADPQVIINVVIFLLNLRNKDNETIDDHISKLSKIPADKKTENIQNQINLLNTIKACLNDAEMCEYRKMTGAIIEKESNQFSLQSLLRRSNDGEDNIIDDNADDSE